ncbi:hypothetical protein [Propionivibrio sp.]|uniref:hypothetical protein n=1 Tax=Propionivibrio sp. TaxID=2212460 RepID=UPI0039E46325
MAKTREGELIYTLSAEQFAELNQVRAQTVRARLCQTGSYFGVTPKKLMNGRLAWPDVQVAVGEQRHGSAGSVTTRRGNSERSAQ